MQQQRRSTSDDDSNNDHEYTRSEGKTGGNAGAGKSGAEDLGTEKKIDDERFGSRKAYGRGSRGGRGEKGRTRQIDCRIPLVPMKAVDFLQNCASGAIAVNLTSKLHVLPLSKFDNRY